MKNYSIMLKPASSLCDLRCKYCFYADVSNLRCVRSFGVMRDETALELIRNIERSLAPGDQVTLAFQGGEPTLAGLGLLHTIVEAAGRWDRGIRVHYALQTNAMHLDEEWCRFLKEHDFLVGVSHDLLPEQHNAVRVDAAGAPTMKRVEQSIALLRKHDVAFNVLCTLTNQIARHPQQVWKRILQLDLQYVQFTPCLDELDHPGESVYAITPKRFASFYNTLFRLWLAEYQAGRYRSVKLFDDVISALAFGIPGTCGMGGRCQPQLVVEADGTVYPCDFYCLDPYALGDLTKQTIPELFSSPALTAFLDRPRAPRPAHCAECAFAGFCGGGCERMQREVCCSGNGTFCGYEDFLTQNIAELQRIAQAERQMRQGLPR